MRHLVRLGLSQQQIASHKPVPVRVRFEDKRKDEVLEDNIDCQPNKKQEAPDLSFALIRALQCYIFFLRIELDPFPMSPHLLHVSYLYINALCCCGLRSTNVTFSFALFGWPRPPRKDKAFRVVCDVTARRALFFSARQN